MITGERLAEQAVNGRYIGIPYKKLDCQGFVEKVISDLGIRKPDGTVYNWRGSNAMYRNYYSWRGTVAECGSKFGIIPQGALIYKMKHDGGEKEKGYIDNLGNFYHVGIYIGDEDRMVMHSSTGGVQYAKSLNGWTNVSLLSFIDYTGKNADNNIKDLINAIRADLDKLEGLIL